MLIEVRLEKPSAMVLVTKKDSFSQQNNKDIYFSASLLLHIRVNAGSVWEIGDTSLFQARRPLDYPR